MRYSLHIWRETRHCYARRDFGGSFVWSHPLEGLAQPGSGSVSVSSRTSASASSRSSHWVFLGRPRPLFFRSRALSVVSALKMKKRKMQNQFERCSGGIQFPTRSRHSKCVLTSVSSGCECTRCTHDRGYFGPTSDAPLAILELVVGLSTSARLSSSPGRRLRRRRVQGLWLPRKLPRCSPCIPPASVV